MMKRLRNALDGEGGFTLIELLIVVVILGILAAIVVFSVAGIKDRGQTAACQTEKSTIVDAQEAYYAQQLTYATSLGQLGTAGLLNVGTAGHYYTTGSSTPSGPGATYTVTSVNSACP